MSFRSDDKIEFTPSELNLTQPKFYRVLQVIALPDLTELRDDVRASALSRRKWKMSKSPSAQRVSIA